MATILGLAMKVTADASGLPASLTPVEKALANLGKQADASASLFDQFLNSTTGAASAQADVARQFEALNSSLRDGSITAQDFAGAFSAIQQSAQETARIFQEGAATTSKYRTETEGVGLEVERLNEQLKVGAIDQETYRRAIADVTGENERAAAAEEERQQFLERAAQLTRAVVTPMERYDATVQELNTHLQAGTITQETYERNLAQATQEFIKAESAAQGYDKAAESAGNAGSLAFNEMTGILAAIPGPIGNIAGRLSGLSSAAEGLGRVFDGGIRAGLNSITASISGLINPTTLAVAGVAAFGAAATAVASGLSTLAGRVEELTNLAGRLGTSFGFVQVLEESAKRSGVSIDTLAKGMQRFSINIDEARSGTGKASEAFDKLGVSQADLQTSDPTQLAGRVAKALGEIEDPATRAALATELLGKSGLELLPAFASIDDAESAMKRFGSTIDDVAGGQLLALDDALDNLSLAATSLGSNLLQPFAGLAKGIASALSEIIGGISRFVGAVGDTLRPVFSVIGSAVETVGTAIGRAIGAIGSWVEGFNRLIGVQSQSTRATEQQREALEQLAQEDLQNFEGMAKSIESVNAQLSKAIDESVQFGQAGFDAALQYQNALEELKQQFEAGILNETSYKRAVDEATKSYNEQIGTIKQVAEQSAKKADAEKAAAAKIVEDNKKIADSLLEQLRIDKEFGGDSGRAKSAENVKAIEQEIARVEEEARRAREAGDQAAAGAAAARLAGLDQVLAKERDNASGITAENKRIAEDKKRLDEQREKALLDAAKAINAAEVQFIEARFDLEKKRVEELNKLRRGGITIEDIRTAGGSETFLDLLAGREDAAISEYRKQLEELRALRQELRDARVKKVEILKGVG